MKKNLIRMLVLTICTTAAFGVIYILCNVYEIVRVLQRMS